MAATAAKTWAGDPNDGPRWDHDAQRGHPRVIMEAAAEALPHFHINGFEGSIGQSAMFQAAMLRESYAPMLYDYSRAKLAMASENAAVHHIDTRALAEQIATLRPSSLALARTILRPYPPRDIDEQYFLWKHSLLPVPVADWPPDAEGANAGAQAAAIGGLTPCAPKPADLDFLDAILTKHYNGHMRGPEPARVAFADAGPTSVLRGTTLPSGDMILGRRPGQVERFRRTIIEEAAHSLLRRHLAPKARDFSSWWDRQAAGRPHAHPAFTLGMRAPGRRDHVEHLAHAIAQAIVDGPSDDPTGPNAPVSEAVQYAQRLFRAQVAKPESFRAL